MFRQSEQREFCALHCRVFLLGKMDVMYYYGIWIIFLITEKERHAFLDMDFINEDIEKQKARNKYNEIVKNNIKALCENKKDKLMDPDKYSNYDVKISGLKISLSQDGICSYSKIEKFSNGDVVKNYILLRKDMFDCLCWPAYAMSINQMRSAKFNDRLDLLFIDLYNFYEIVSENTELSEKSITKIWRECKLARAYIFPHTFYWLRSFIDFKNFMNSRKLNPFLEEKSGRPVEWGNSINGFDDEYFEKLIEKVNQYKEVM